MLNKTFRYIGLGIALIVLVSLPASPQTATPPALPQRVIINFIVPITSESVNALLGVVNAQVSRGIKKITIAIASPGGDPSAGFAAYNVLHGFESQGVEITTFNTGNIDSAAILIFCAGQNRYSLPSPARFLIHSAALNPINTNFPVDRTFIAAELAQLNNLNQVMEQVLKANSNKQASDIEAAINTQTILSPEDAKNWGLIQDIKPTFMEPDALFLAVNGPEPPKPQPEHTSPFTTQNPVTSTSQ